ncbi:MAG: DNA polymerase III subunit alpha, partial [Alistipes sp.]|nr:DNA polymerase III subunit alpha [Alistipes sp.]
PPEHTPWTKLETLNREREVVGIYLSSHPLDDFSVIIRHYCNTTMGELADLALLNGREFMAAGMVTAVQHLTTKTGKPYGRFTVEDYNGSHDFVLFSKDYEKFRRYLFEGYYLFLRGKVTPRIYNPNELETRITSIMMLSEAQETLMKEITVWVPLGDLTEAFIARIRSITHENKGKVLFRVKVYDPAADVAVNLYSRSVKVEMTAAMVRFLDDYALRYTLM